MVDVLYWWLINFSANSEAGGLLEQKTLTDPHRKTLGRKGLINPHPLVLNPIKNQVAAAGKSKTSMGQSLKTHKLHLGNHLVFEN
jgi:hypothetical protein